MKRFPFLNFGIVTSMFAFGLISGIPLSAQQSSSSQNQPSTPAFDSSTSDSESYGSNVTQSGGQSPFYGSVPEGKASAYVLSLSIKDAMERGLRNNLGLLLESDNTLEARGEKWKELSALLPNVNATITESVAQIDLAAQGF